MAVTATPGSAPPVASVTTPLIVASDVCAFASAGIHAGVAPAIESTVTMANRARMNTSFLFNLHAMTPSFLSSVGGFCGEDSRTLTACLQVNDSVARRGRPCEYAPMRRYILGRLLPVLSCAMVLAAPPASLA